MKTLDEVLAELGGVETAELEAWVAAEWVRPERSGGGLRFADIDVARVRLIRELRYELAVEPETVPVVLSLLDQLYDLRRRLRALTEAVCAEPEPVRRDVMRRYRASSGHGGRGQA